MRNQSQNFRFCATWSLIDQIHKVEEPYILVTPTSTRLYAFTSWFTSSCCFTCLYSSLRAVQETQICPLFARCGACMHALYYNHSLYRLHNEVEVFMRYTPPRAVGERWCKSHRDRTEVCNWLVQCLHGTCTNTCRWSEGQLIHLLGGVQVSWPQRQLIHLLTVLRGVYLIYIP